MRYVKYLLVVFLLMPFSPTYGQETKSEAGQETPEAQGKVKRVIATVDPDGVQRVEVLGGEYYFDPSHIVVKVNVPVELKVKKTPGITPHNISVKAPEAGIEFTTDMKSDEPVVIKFTPTKVGRYLMYCDKRFLFFKSHKNRGMEGAIDVVE